MSRLFDFNLDNNNQKTSNASKVINKANCNVYINTKTKSDFNTNQVLPNIDENPYSDLKTRDIQLQNLDIKPNDEISNQFYKILAITLIDILKSNNVKLIANLLDLSGKIIIDANALCLCIALICNVDEKTVNLKYIDKETGCTGKIDPIKRVKNIQVNGQDMNICYNKEYNTLQNKFNICLDKIVLV